MPAERVTYAEYLEWMRLMPRTHRWDAFVAYDRDKCNQLLFQEYVEKFDHDSYMLPIDQPYGSSDTEWTWLQNYVTDVPRLSFENNYDNDSSAEVNLKMAIVGGSEITLTDSNGFPQVTRISSFDPLDHPELVAERVVLRAGWVNLLGKVVLDVGDVQSQNYAWELSGSRYERERRVRGGVMKRLFREADPARRTYTLGQLTYTEQDFMKPSMFKLRTIMESDADRKGASNFGNGVVELRIAMRGSPEGDLPGADWRYPLPSDMPDINACIILGNGLLMNRVVPPMCAPIYGADGDIRVVEQVGGTGFIDTVNAGPDSKGLVYSRAYGPGQAQWQLYGYPYHSSGKGAFSVSYDGTTGMRIHLGRLESPWQSRLTIEEIDYDEWPDMGVMANCKILFSLDGGKVGVALGESPLVALLPHMKRDLNFDGRELDPVLEEMVGELTYGVGLEFEKVEGKIGSIDAFVLNSLLFNSRDAVTMKHLDFTGDLLLLGSISPRLTAFAISPEEMLLGYGDSCTFITDPPTQVTWSVENLDGTAIGAGTIDPVSGQYIAPGLEDIAGTYTRLKVVATGPAGEGGQRHVSKALVMVVTRAITLNPLVQTCPASKSDAPQTRELSAGTLSGNLSWSVIGDGSINTTSDEEGHNVYTAPLAEDTSETRRTFSIDEIKVVNDATGQQQSSLIVVTHNVQAVAWEVEDRGDGQMKFSGEIQGYAFENPTWACVPESGAGSIDGDGLYTVDPDSTQSFVIITVRDESVSGRFYGDGYYILPLPIRAFPPKPEPEPEP